MDSLTSSELDNLPLKELIERMDEIIEDNWYGRGNKIMKLTLSSIMETKRVNEFNELFQRKIAYKAFSFYLQILYTDFLSGANFINPTKSKIAKQITWATRYQSTIVSSRMALEYFYQLVFMIGNGEEFKSTKETFKKFKKWLKESNNNYNYLALMVARSFKFTREKRDPEVHGGTKFARKILKLSADTIDNEIFQLLTRIKNEWQSVVSIANGKDLSGYMIEEDKFDDKEFYNLWKNQDKVKINKLIDSMDSKDFFVE